MKYDVYIPTHIMFGAGRLNDLHSQALPGKTALVVISNGKSTRANGYLDRTVDQLTQAGVKSVVFDGVGPNPLKSAVMAGAQAARDGGCDFIVALGGGSVMDASKAIALMATNPGDYWDYIPAGTGKGQTPEIKPLPIVAITTTAGTGSETDFFAVVTNEETREKVGWGTRDLFPVIGIVDPELMTTVPPKFTAYQGFDALLQVVECAVSNRANWLGDMYSYTAAEHIGAWLPTAVADGANVEAREHVAFGNVLSGAAMLISSCTSEHSLEHVMSARHQDLPHGAGLIIISKAYHQRFIDAGVADAEYIRLAKALGNASADKPQDFIAALTALQRACGVADLKMSDFGFTKDDFRPMAEQLQITEHLSVFDRMPLTLDDCIAIYEQSFR